MERRQFISAGVIGLAGVACGLGMQTRAATGKSNAKSAPIAATPPAPVTQSALLERAKAAMETHQSSLLNSDRIGIADYSLHSSEKRFHIVDMIDGSSQSFLVAHGKGSDLKHTGWLQEFSNVPGSEASSGGSYMTAQAYVGKHGRSRRLKGLDPSNNMAEPRAIVIHGAWYAEPEMVSAHGKLGRSQGCFAFSETDLAIILERLGPGRLLFADKA